jgi:hypothetical protein
MFIVSTDKNIDHLEIAELVKLARRRCRTEIYQACCASLHRCGA